MECVICVSVWLGVGGVVGEWLTGLGLCFTNSGGTWDMCLCFGCGGVGGVWREWVGGLGHGLEWCYGCVCCESGLSMLMAGPAICILRLADTCAS